MPEAEITNALIRCTREDNLPKEAFTLARDDLGLWVYELSENLDKLIEELKKIRPLLLKLSDGSTDYTLHIAATIGERRRMIIPKSLAALSAECGFSIEIYSSLE